jgi:hypothetical protein
LVKILKFFDADLGSGMEKIRIRDPEKHPGSATLLIMIVQISNVVDLDKQGSAFILVGWTQIRIQEGKNNPQK